jgi:hypothetical protein
MEYIDYQKYINTKRKKLYIESLIIFFDNWHLNNKKK